MTFVRLLNDDELLANYTRSYSNSASNYEGGLWPHTFDNSPAEGQTIEEYTEETYYSKNH